MPRVASGPTLTIRQIRDPKMEEKRAELEVMHPRRRRHSLPSRPQTAALTSSYSHSLTSEFSLGVGVGVHDLLMLALCRCAKRIVGRKLYHRLLEHFQYLEQKKIYLATHVDAAAILDQEVWTPEISKSINLLRDLIRGLDRSNPVDRTRVSEVLRYFRTQYLYFAVSALLQRVGELKMAKLHEQMPKAGFNDVIHDVRGWYFTLQSEHDDFYDRFFENVELQAVNAPIPLDAISSTLQMKIEDICTICTDPIQVDEAVKLNVYGHLFCSGCVQPWINGSQKQANACPNCRAELFPRRKFRVSASAQVDVDRLVEMESIMREVDIVYDRFVDLKTGLLPPSTLVLSGYPPSRIRTVLPFRASDHA